MNYRRAFSICKREYLHNLRESRYFLILILLPLIALLLNAYTMNTEVRPWPLAAADNDGTANSRKLLRILNNSALFKVRTTDLDETAKNRLEIPEGFTRTLLNGEPLPPIEVQLDATDPMLARIYLAGLNSLVSGEQPGYQIKFQTLFNPTLNSFAGYIPGLLGCILMSVIPIFAAISIVREREDGSFERLLASPASSMEFLTGKFLAFFSMAILQFILLLVVSLAWFGITIQGNSIELAVVVAVYCLWCVIFGLTISTYTKTQVGALVAGVVLTLLPAFIFSGLYFPIQNIPWSIRWIAYLIPTQYFTEIAREIFLKGNNFWEWWRSFAGLSLLTIFTFLLMYLRFRKIAKGPA